MMAIGDDVAEEFAKSQVSYGCARKFAWLAPLTKTKAPLNLDLWDEKAAPLLCGVIRYREDKFTHQIEVRSAKDVEAVQALGWDRGRRGVGDSVPDFTSLMRASSRWSPSEHLLRSDQAG